MHHICLLQDEVWLTMTHLFLAAIPCCSVANMYQAFTKHFPCCVCERAYDDNCRWILGL